MKKILIMLAFGGLVCIAGAGSALADSHVEGELKPASPLELFACTYNEGKGPADLDQAAAAWNAWADKHDLNGYSAWTLVPYYSGPEQEFDALWIGGSSKAATLGAARAIERASKWVAGARPVI